MRWSNVFSDKLSEQLHRQVFEVSSYINKELDKRIVKQLLLKVLEKNLLPILVYPEREQPNVMPMWYSSGERQINIHTPVPEVKLLTEDEAISMFESEETIKRLFENMIAAVEKLE